jgi:hypothetical protein
MSSERTPVMSIIEEAVRDVPGWSPLDQLFALFTLAYSTAHLPGDIVELGSWCGRSAVALGLAAKISGKGRVHCVDLFPSRDDWYRNEDGSYSFKVRIGEWTHIAYSQQTVWPEPFEKDILSVYERFPESLDAFNHTIRCSGLDEHVTPYKGNLMAFGASVPVGFACRLAFVDGDHGYAALCDDIEQIERILLPGGWLCFDDAFSGYQGVDRAIEERIIRSAGYDLTQQLTRKLFAARRSVPGVGK